MPDLPTVPPGDPRYPQAAETPAHPALGQIWEWRGTERPRQRYEVESTEPDAVTLIPCDRHDPRPFIKVGLRTLAAEYDLVADVQSDVAPGPVCGAREVGGPAVCTREPGHPRDVHEQQIGLNVLRWACEPEDVAPGPDVDAGGAGDEVYLAIVEGVYGPTGWNKSIDDIKARVVAKPEFRAAVDGVVDAARAPLLAERAEDRKAYIAQVERLIRERDEARAKTDGGEWHEERGVRWPNGELMWGDRTARYSSLPRLKRRVWIGPPEPAGPVTDDGSGHA